MHTRTRRLLSRSIPRWSLWMCGAVFAGWFAFFLIRWYFDQPSETGFTATVQTRSLAFTVGDWPDSAGLFVQGRDPVDLTIQTPCHLLGAAMKTQGGEVHRGQTFRQAVLMSMDVSPGTRVAVDVEDGLLIFNLERAPAPQQQQSTTKPNAPWIPFRFELTKDSPDLVAHRPQRDLMELSPGDEGTRSMEFSIRFRGDPEPQLNIPILTGSNVSFQKEAVSQLLPGKAVLLLREPNSALKGASDIALQRLTSGAVEEMVLEPKKDASFPVGDARTQGPRFQVDFLSLRISGKTSEIQVQSVAGASPRNIATRRLPEYITSSRLQGLGAVASALLVFLVFLFEESHRRWERDKDGDEIVTSWRNRSK